MSQNSPQANQLVKEAAAFLEKQISFAQEILNDPAYTELHPALQLCFKIQLPSAQFAYNAFVKLAKESGYEV